MKCNETCQAPVVCDRSETLHSELRSLTGFMMETLHKELRNIHLYDVVNANVLKLDALKICEVPTAGLPILFSKCSDSTGAVLELRDTTVPGRATTILEAKDNVAGQVKVLENKPLDKYVYYKPRSRLGAFAIGINRKRLWRPITVRESAVKKAHVKRSSTGEGLSSAAPEAKNEDVLMNIVLDDAERLVADNETSILESALQMYCRVFQSSFQELPDHLEQCACDVEMKINLILTDSVYNVRQELGRLASDYDLFSEDDIVEIMNMCGDYLKLVGHAHIFCSSVQLLSWDYAVSASAETVKFLDSGGNEQVRDEASFDQEKEGLVYVRDRRNLNRNPSRKIHYYLNMAEQAVLFWRRGLDVD